LSRDVQAGRTARSAIARGEHFPIGLLVRNRYRIVSERGAGAYGTVCLADDESTGHRVAIRFLPRRLAETPDAAQAVLRMARPIVAASSAPGLTCVLEFGEVDNGRPYAIMELVEGRRLSEIMSKGKPLDVAAAMRMALDLGGAVETLHNMGFIHSALCPHNIVVLEDGRIKLLDLELVGLREAREIQDVIAAEPPAEYLSPEQILKAPVSEKADIYAFGAILYELLSGVPPFQAATREAVRLLEAQEALMIFPEGGRSADGSVGPFKPGAFRLAVALNTPILPVTIHGGTESWPPGRLLPRPGNLRIVYHPLIHSDRSLEPRRAALDLAHRARELIAGTQPPV